MREHSDIVQVTLRIREAERAGLEADARSNGVSMNAEIASRLRHKALLRAEDVVESVCRYLGPLADNAHELAKAGDMARVAGEMAGLLQSVLDGGVLNRDATRAAVERYSAVRHMIRFESELRLRQMTTDPGAQS